MRAKASSTSCSILMVRRPIFSSDTSGGWGLLALSVSMRAILSATSPIRSRSVMVLMMAITSRKSEAVGWRLAMMRVHSSSMATSIAFTLWSLATILRAASRSWSWMAAMASVSCCSTMPPITSTWLRTPSSSALNWPEICLLRFILSIQIILVAPIMP